MHAERHTHRTTRQSVSTRQGGGVYVNAFTLINKEVDPNLREMALSSACVADSTGILLADIMSLYWQWCLFAANGIADQADGACPFNDLVKQ